MISIWLIVMLGLLGLIILLAIALISPVTLDIQYKYHSKHKTQPPRVIKLAAPGTGLILKLFWGLLKLNFRLSTASIGHHNLQPHLKVGAQLKVPPGATSTAKATLGPEQILKQCLLLVKLGSVLAPVHRYLLSHTTLRCLNWRTGLGLEEAHHTGLAVGAVWALKSGLTAKLYKLLKCKMAPPELEVIPLFKHSPAFWVQFNCIITIRLGHIIYAGLLTSWLSLKNSHKIWGYK